MPAKFGPKEYGIVAAAIAALALAIFVVARGVTADSPKIINTPPQNVVGTSEKSREMAKQNAADSKAQVAAPGGGGGSPGDDVQPPPAK